MSGQRKSSDLDKSIVLGYPCAGWHHDSSARSTACPWFASARPVGDRCAASARRAAAGGTGGSEGDQREAAWAAERKVTGESLQAKRHLVDALFPKWGPLPGISSDHGPAGSPEAREGRIAEVTEGKNLASHKHFARWPFNKAADHYLAAINTPRGRVHRPHREGGGGALAGVFRGNATGAAHGANGGPISGAEEGEGSKRVDHEHGGRPPQAYSEESQPVAYHRRGCEDASRTQ